MSAMKSIIVFAALLAVSGVADARRLLKAPGRDWGETGDPNGYDVLANARSFDGGPGTPKRAVTPEAAESTANNKFLGLWRREMGSSTAAFATVENDPNFSNPDRTAQTVRPRARAAIDEPNLKKKVDLISGNEQIPTVAMGGAAVSQTYEGALAASASDAIQVAGKNYGKKTTHANSMLTSYTADVPRASKVASYGVTAQNANSVSLAGPADGRLVVAQAHESAAMAQASNSNADQWQSAAGDKEKIGKKNNK